MCRKFVPCFAMYSHRVYALRKLEASARILRHSILPILPDGRERWPLERAKAYRPRRNRRRRIERGQTDLHAARPRADRPRASPAPSWTSGPERLAAAEVPDDIDGARGGWCRYAWRRGTPPTRRFADRVVDGTSPAGPLHLVISLRSCAGETGVRGRAARRSETSEAAPFDHQPGGEDAARTDGRSRGTRRARPPRQVRRGAGRGGRPSVRGPARRRPAGLARLAVVLEVLFRVGERAWPGRGQGVAHRARHRLARVDACTTASPVTAIAARAQGEPSF